MARKSDNSNYGTVAVTIHRLSALLIIALLISVFRAGQKTDLAAKADILRFHAPMGITILILTLARIIWWWRFDTKPAAVGGDPRWQELSARAVHILFYIIIIGMTASGIGMFVLSGAGPILFGGAEGALPDFTKFAPRVPHGLGARAMIALFVLHAGAALYHHFLKGDMTLRRMWFYRGGTK
jgi:cytochrome b561